MASSSIIVIKTCNDEILIRPLPTGAFSHVLTHSFSLSQNANGTGHILDITFSLSGQNAIVTGRVLAAFWKTNSGENVKYGETFRRFSASIEDKKIALDIVTLREKIRSLFSFGSNIDFTLTYVDEDGDEVTLVDDYDLHDVVRQSLSPLRITMKLNNVSPGGTNVLFDHLKLHHPHSQFQNLNSGATSSSPGVAKLAEKMQEATLNQISYSMGGLRMQPPAGGASNVDGQQGVSSESSTVKGINSSGSSGSTSTPPRSPQNQILIQSLISRFAEIVLSVPEPFLEALAKIPLELVSKAPASSPMVTEVLKQTVVYLDHISASVASQKVHTPTSGSSDVNSEPSTLIDSRISVNREAGCSNSKKTEKQVQKVTKGMTSSRKDLGLTSLNLNLPPIIKNPEVVDQNHLMDSGNILINVPDPEAASADSDAIDQDTGFPNDSVISEKDDVSSTMATRSPAEVAAMSSFSDSTEVETASTSLPVGPVVSSGFYPSVGLHPKSTSSPTMDFSVMSSTLVRGAPPPTRIPVVQTLDSTSQEVSVLSDHDKEQELLKYLEKIGFKKPDLNRKILRMNSYDLEKSIDDLCCALEWEPMLDNLQEMGFVDEETNRRLLEKNDGSITLTVMDLINEETA